MDELLDLADLLASRALFDLADVADVIADLDIEGLDMDTLVAFDGLDPADLDWDLDFDEDAGDLDDSAGDDWDDVTDEPAPPTTEQVNAELTAAAGEYPSYMTESTNVVYDPEPAGNMRGAYDPQTGTIALFDHAETAEWTYHHEMGHHIQHRDPEFAAKLQRATQDVDYGALRPERYSAYDPAHQAEEIGSDAIADYQRNPIRFMALFPKLGVLISEYLT